MKLRAALLATAALAISSQAQSYRRFELGSHTTMVRLASETHSCSGCPAPNWMVGPEFAFNLNQHFAIDGAVSESPFSISGSSDTYGGRLAEALIGPKASIRSRRFTLFTKARPGFVSWSHALTDFRFLNFPPTSFADIKTTYGRRNFFALNLTGGIEYALSPRVTLTAELGDTLVRPTYRSGYAGPMTNNVQTSLGASYHFGEERSFEHRIGPTHKFFDRTNIGLMTVSLLAQSADAITTQRRLAHCWRTNPHANDSFFGCPQEEADPIARPFVTHGWGGQVSLAIIVNSAQTLVMYAAHRMGYHRVERAVPIPLTIESGIAAYRNLQR
jgi:hypothetical protein